MLISFESIIIIYQNEIWSNTSVLYEKHGSLLETGN